MEVDRGDGRGERKGEVERRVGWAGWERRETSWAARGGEGHQGEEKEQTLASWKRAEAKLPERLPHAGVEVERARAWWGREKGGAGDKG